MTTSTAPDPIDLLRMRRLLRDAAGACPACGRGGRRSIAADIGIGYSTLNRFMTGNRAVSGDAMDRIRTYLDEEPARADQ